MPLISLSCLITLARTSSTSFNKSGENGLPCFFPDLTGKVFSFAPLSYDVSCSLVSYDFYYVEICSFFFEVKKKYFNIHIFTSVNSTWYLLGMHTHLVWFASCLFIFQHAATLWDCWVELFILKEYNVPCPQRVLSTLTFSKSPMRLLNMVVFTETSYLEDGKTD